MGVSDIKQEIQERISLLVDGTTDNDSVIRAEAWRALLDLRAEITLPFGLENNKELTNYGTGSGILFHTDLRFPSAWDDDVYVQGTSVSKKDSVLGGYCRFFVKDKRAGELVLKAGTVLRIQEVKEPGLLKKFEFVEWMINDQNIEKIRCSGTNVLEEYFDAQTQSFKTRQIMYKARLSDFMSGLGSYAVLESSR